jgi:hypothetical protein
MRSSSWISHSSRPLHPAPAQDHIALSHRAGAARRHTHTHPPSPSTPGYHAGGGDRGPLFHSPDAGLPGCALRPAGPQWSRGDSNPGPPPCKGGALPAKLRPPARRLAPVCGRAWTRTRDLGLIRTALSPPELRAPPRRGQTPRGGVCAEDGVNPQGPHSGSVRSPAGTKMARPQLGVAARWSTVHHPAPRQDQSGSLDLSPGHP